LASGRIVAGDCLNQWAGQTVRKRLVNILLSLSDGAIKESQDCDNEAEEVARNPEARAYQPKKVMVAKAIGILVNLYIPDPIATNAIYLERGSAILPGFARTSTGFNVVPNNH
jgi:hypothetical protein